MMFRRTVMGLLLLFSVTACDGARLVGTSDTNHIQYEKYGITRLKVGEIQVVNTYVPIYHAPNVEHQLFLPPYIALRDWARHRYQAVGNMGVAKIEILDASIIEKDIPVARENFGIWDNTIETEFRLRMQVRIEINSPNYIDLPFAEATVVRKFRFPEQTTYADQQELLQNSVAEALDKMDILMTQTIRDKWDNVAVQ